jgi:hypothetical protein
VNRDQDNPSGEPPHETPRADLIGTFGDLRDWALGLPLDRFNEGLCRAVVTLADDVVRDCTAKAEP